MLEKSIRKISYVPARVREVFRVEAAEKAPWGGVGKPPIRIHDIPTSYVKYFEYEVVALVLLYHSVGLLSRVLNYVIFYTILFPPRRPRPVVRKIFYVTTTKSEGGGLFPLPSF